jgi:hypothetical protein
MLKQEYNTLITLLRCSVTEEKFIPDNKTDWLFLYQLAKAHSVQGLVYEGIKDWKEAPPALIAHLKQDAGRALVIDTTQCMEIQQLQDIFESRHIPVIMLKGWVMKPLYPRTELRSMTDTDIFMGPESAEEVRDIMKAQGYEIYSYGGKKDDIYHKPPYTTVEMHKTFFAYEDDWNQLLTEPQSELYVWNRRKSLEGKQYVSAMEPELCYVYLLAHMAKHMRNGSSGVRSFLDLWIFRQKHPDLQWDIINRDLTSLGLTVFADRVRQLTESWFDKQEMNPDFEPFVAHVMEGGTYGNEDNFVASNAAMQGEKQPSRIQYLFRRGFPNRASMELRFPKLKEHHAWLPYYYVKRLWRDGFKRMDAVKGEVRSVKNIDYEQIQQVQQMYQEWGL